jgi:hypothetical protein
MLLAYVLLSVVIAASTCGCLKIIACRWSGLGPLKIERKGCQWNLYVLTEEGAHFTTSNALASKCLWSYLRSCRTACQQGFEGLKGWNSSHPRLVLVPALTQLHRLCLHNSLLFLPWKNCVVSLYSFTACKQAESLRVAVQSYIDPPSQLAHSDACTSFYKGPSFHSSPYTQIPG